MPKEKRTPDAMPSDELLFAAIERAECHRIKHDDPELHRGKPDQPGVLFATIKEHAGVRQGGWTTIQLRPAWERLENAGLIEQARLRGMTVWTLTSAGQKHLDAARAASEVGQLPESPQHRYWRESREIASRRIGEFGELLRKELADATGLLDAHDTPDSDAWHAISRRLQRACERLESASYCLLEWPEPDDSAPDIPPKHKVGRRSVNRFDND
ncbi:MAG: hypothetical protein ABSG93_20690 [Solirubrobacteraceae bacterium]|jgi:hypothetical protein